MVYYAVAPVYFIGDLHGNFHWLKKFIEDNDLHDCSLIFCGDNALGAKTLKAWFGWIQGLKLDKCLKKRRIGCYFVRGNHDDPSWYDDKTLVTSCFKAVSDYSTIETPDHNILCVGGGISIDRYDRKISNDIALHRYMKYHPNVSMKEAMKVVQQVYWENENPLYDDRKIDSLTHQIDTVCSHVAPTCFPPEPDCPKRWAELDGDLRDDCFLERRVMDQVLNRLLANDHPIRNWFYGHYHRYEVSEHNGITGHLLDMARDSKLCIKELR